VKVRDSEEQWRATNMPQKPTDKQTRQRSIHRKGTDRREKKREKRMDGMT